MPLSSNCKGPSVILNSGSVANTNLSNTNKFGKYGLDYVVGKGNATFKALTDVVDRLVAKHKGDANTKRPWSLNESTGMVTIKTSSKRCPPVMDEEKRVIPRNSVKDGDFTKVNLTPLYYEMEETGSYVLPDGSRKVHKHTKKGVSLMLNGVLLLSGQGTEEELF
jgi:hypothetical protein